MNIEKLEIVINIWQKSNTTYQFKHFMPPMKHRGGRVIIWGFFKVKGPGYHAITESTVNPSTYDEFQSQM